MAPPLHGRIWTPDRRRRIVVASAAAGGGGGVSFAHTHDALSTSDETTDTFATTFSNVSLGTPFASRQILVAACTRTRDLAVTGSSVMINGVEATKLASQVAFDDYANCIAEFWIAPVPLGELVDVVTVFTTPVSRLFRSAGLSVYSLGGYDTSPEAVAGVNNDSTVNIALATTIGARVIALKVDTSTSSTWGGMVTENCDRAGSNIVFSTASGEAVATTSNISVGMNAIFGAALAISLPVL